MKNLIMIALLAMTISIGSANEIAKQNSNVQVVEQEEFNDEFSNEFKEEKEVFDPLSGYNRAMTSFNDFFYINILEPTAEGYAYVVPEPARVGVSNFFHNITFPIRFVNNILQLKFENAAEETGRFLVNSTFGILGFMDPASSEFGWEKHDEDFGQTLGYYGVGEGFHIVLPFLGPSNLRDMVGLAGDSYFSPITDSSAMDYKIPKHFGQTVSIAGVNAVNRTSLNLGQYENLKKDAIDLYPFLKEIYNQNRQKKIKE